MTSRRSIDRNGCAITIVDIDKHHCIEPWLQTMTAATPSLRYVVGDAMAFLQADSDDYDVLYFSGFTPEEARRGEMQANELRRLARRIGLHLARVTKAPPPSWPDDGAPFGPFVTEAIRRGLRTGGLFMSQSYESGVALTQNPHYLDCVKSQLHGLGVELIAYYTFEFPWTNVALAVGIKGDREAARAFERVLDARPELRTFHGRSAVATGIVIHRVTC